MSERKRKPTLKNRPCLAPFNSIFFSMTGHAYFCLENKALILGKYPENQVDEIICGDIAQSLRSDFLLKKFLQGCEGCQKHMEMGTGAAAFYNFHKMYPPGKDFVPRYIDFELDNRCNLSCIMCRPYFSSSARPSDETDSKGSVPYDESFFRSFDLYAPHLIRAHFRGGEPFLIRAYQEFWERLIRINPRIRIGTTTNGTVLTPVIRRMFETGNFDINISIDSIRRETFEKIRKGASFENWKNNLNELISLKQMGKINLSACSCLMTVNWPEFPEIFSFCTANGLSLYINYVTTPIALSLLSYSDDDLEKIILHLRKSWPCGKKALPNHNLQVWQTMLKQIEHWRLSERQRFAGLKSLVEEMEAEKKKFFDSLSHFTDMHRQFSSFDEAWFVSRVLMLEKQKIPGIPVDIIYSELNRMSLPFIFEKIPGMSDDEICKNLLDKYLQLVKMTDLYEDHPPVIPGI